MKLPQRISYIEQMKRKYISIQTESKIDDPVHPSTKAVGIDLGIKK